MKKNDIIYSTSVQLSLVALNRYLDRFMRIDPIRRQSIITLFFTVSLTGIGYLATIYFAHVLGAAILGSYYLFLAYFGIFDLVGDGGFGGATVKRISEGKDENQFFTSFIMIRIVLLAISILLLLLLHSFIIDLSEENLIPWLIIAMAAGTAGSIVASGVYGTKQVGVNQVSNFVNTVVKIVFQIIATYLGYQAGGLAGGFIAGTIAGTLLNYRYLYLKISKFNSTHLKSLFSFSFWIFLAAGGSLVFAYADVILIGYFLSNADVGIYRIALQLASVASFITLALHTVLYPQISHWHATGDLPRIGNALSRSITYSLILAVPVLAGGIILRDRLLYFLYGAEFAVGSNALVILLFVQVVTIFMYLQTMCLNAMNLPKKSFIATVLAAAANIILNIALIPFLGIVGSAIATFLSIGLNALIAYYYLRIAIDVKIERNPVLNIIIAVVIMSVVLVSFRFWPGIENVFALIAAVILGAGIYFIVLFHQDRGIRDEMRDILLKLGIPIPAFI